MSTFSRSKNEELRRGQREDGREEEGSRRKRF